MLGTFFWYTVYIIFILYIILLLFVVCESYSDGVWDTGALPSADEFRCGDKVTPLTLLPLFWPITLYYRSAGCLHHFNSGFFCCCFWLSVPDQVHCLGRLIREMTCNVKVYSWLNQCTYIYCWKHSYVTSGYPEQKWFGRTKSEIALKSALRSGGPAPKIPCAQNTEFYWSRGCGQ